MKQSEKSTEKKKTKNDLCLECLECCKKLKIPVGRFLDFNARDFYNAREIDIIFSPNEEMLMFVLPHTCPKLTPEGCSIYEDRPLACRVYDGRTDPVVDCKWKELEEE